LLGKSLGEKKLDNLSSFLVPGIFGSFHL